MRLFGLQPDQVLARDPAVKLPSAATLASSIIYGAVAFGLVSALAYSIWAFKLLRDGPVMYATIAVVYIGFTGLALSRLVLGAGATGRFAALFGVAFLVYAVAWCAFWFGLRGKHQADLWGALLGLAGMTWLLQRAFGASGDFLRCFAVLCALHSLGYYVGDALHAATRGPTGRLLWGAAHGVGFGAGLGYVLFRCQEPLRLRLRSAAQP